MEMLCGTRCGCLFNKGKMPQDYDRVSYIMDQVQQLHVDWRPDVYRRVSPLITREMYEEILKENNWYVAEADGRVAGVLELMKRHVEGPAQVTKDILYISTMAVDEEYRGKGIGHKFFEKVRQINQYGIKGAETSFAVPTFLSLRNNVRKISLARGPTIISWSGKAIMKFLQYVIR